jgi:putative transposase
MENHMKKTRFTESQIINILKEGESGALTVPELCRKHNVGQSTYYKWKSKYGGMQASDLTRMRELEAENAKLKKMFADVSLQNMALKDIVEKKL